MELSRKVCVAAEDASFRCRISFAIQRFVLESVCRGWFGWILGGMLWEEEGREEEKEILESSRM